MPPAPPADAGKDTSSHVGIPAPPFSTLAALTAPQTLEVDTQAWDSKIVSSRP